MLLKEDTIKKNLSLFFDNIFCVALMVKQSKDFKFIKSTSNPSRQKFQWSLLGHWTCTKMCMAWLSISLIMTHIGAMTKVTCGHASMVAMYCYLNTLRCWGASIHTIQQRGRNSLSGVDLRVTKSGSRKPVKFYTFNKTSQKMLNWWCMKYCDKLDGLPKKRRSFRIFDSFWEIAFSQLSMEITGKFITSCDHQRPFPDSTPEATHNSHSFNAISLSLSPWHFLFINVFWGSP